MLVIHTKNNGEISEASSGKSKEELDKLRKQANEIDELDNPLQGDRLGDGAKEGWDVRNVDDDRRACGPIPAKSNILPEQTLGAACGRCSRAGVEEKVSVVGTDAFMDFVETIKAEGVELETQPMGERNRPEDAAGRRGRPRERVEKDIERLDIEMPVLTPRIYREYKNLDLTSIRLRCRTSGCRSSSSPTSNSARSSSRTSTPDEQSHITVLDTAFTPNYQNVIGFFARTIMRDLRLVGGYDVLYGKVKAFVRGPSCSTAGRSRRPQYPAQPLGNRGDANDSSRRSRRRSTR